MFSMHVPKYLWGEAVLTSSYLINRMPTRVLNYSTPLECLKKCFHETRIPSNLPLKIFGCTVYLVRGNQNLNQGLKNVFLLVMHQIRRYINLLIQKLGKLLFLWMLLFLNINLTFKKISSGGETK